MTRKRVRNGFMLAQRAFIKLFVLTEIEEKHSYGYELLENLEEKFKPYAYKPQQSEIYRALHELVDEGYIKRQRKKVPDNMYKEIFLYSIADKDKVKGYKKLMKVELDRCVGLLNYGISVNFP